MDKRSTRFLLTVILILCNLFLYAQDNADTTRTLNDTMRSHNKIYVVMAVCITILAGMIFYLVRIDRKVGKTERNTP